MTDHPDSEGPAPAGAGPRPARIEIPGHVYDLVICAALAAVGAWFFWNALALPATGRSAVVPGTFPMIAGALLFVLCIVQAALSLRARGSLPDVRIERAIHLAIGMVMLLIFPAAVDRFGYYLTAVIWLPAFGWIAGMRSPVTLLGVTVAVLALARFVFEMILGTPLP